MIPALHQELCPNCRASLVTRLYSTPFENDFDRAFTATDPLLCPSNSSSEDEGLETDLVTVTVEVNRLTEVLNALSEHQRRLRARKEGSLVRSLPSPFRRLPTELLSLIFSFCCNSVSPDLWNTSAAISQTCFKWRRIALATPWMWSHLYVGPNQRRGLSLLHHLYLKRAGLKTPLSLRLHLPFRFVDYDSDYEIGIRRLLEEIFLLPGRFARLELHVSAKELGLIRDMQLMDRGLGFTLLETLSLTLDCHLDQDITFPDDFFSAPLLRAVDLVDEQGNSFDFLEGKLPWHQLEHVTTNLRDLSVLDDLVHLDDSEGLLERTIHWNCFPSGIFAGDGHPNVTSLVLSPHMWSSGLVGFFEECYMPALQDLTLEETRHETTPWINVLEALPLIVETSARGLRTLSIILSHEYEVGHQALDANLTRDLLATLECTPTLQTLQVVESASGARCLTQELFEEIQRKGIVPNLKHIELVWSHSHAIPEDSVLEMLALQAGEGLESVVLGVRKGGDVPKRVHDFMQQQRTNGLRASLW